ncbi:hypothetical protein AB835_04355 [Candidatus Endobugula sertula]|uniref:Solute-binding protein family 3/N-terminal domain-containing protein n=1 Tax=Candidatus Endobugula sertula TaxID=62101 RepID=A0A1D2QRR2_9GAMM|nr:hypothetical protein AB835_04355 [Candidatus Endobugula sertula]
MKIFLTMLFLIFSHLAIAEEVITLTSDPYPPYLEFNKDTGTASGVVVDTLGKIFANIPGVKLEYKLLPWERALSSVANGDVDGIPQLSFTEERLEHYVFTDTYLTGKLNLYYKSDKYPNGIDWNELKDLSGYSIGAINGYNYGDVWNEAEKNGHIKVHRVLNPERLLKFLMGGRADLVLVNDQVANLMAKKLGFSDKITPVSKPVKTYIWHMAFSKKSDAKNHVDAINKAIKELKASGEL